MVWAPSPNHYRGRSRYTVDLLVIHYTAGKGDERTTARVFASPRREASAHFCIGRGGGVAQCVDVDDAAWHAGDGGHARAPTVEQLDDVGVGGLVPLAQVPMRPKVNNLRSIGIELCNRGWAPRGPGAYVAGTHRNPACGSTSWESYAEPQLATLVTVVKCLRERFPTMRYVTGHEDVTHQDTLGKPGAKVDPGPAFPWSCLAGLGLRRVAYDFTAHGWRVEELPSG